VSAATLPLRPFGRTGLEITPIGVGAWALGGGWGPNHDEESIATVQRAIERGINWIDTAPAEGPVNSERVIGEALRGMTDRPLLFTKAGFVTAADGRTQVASLKADSIRRQAEGSLERLGVDALDLYQIHWREPDEDIEEAWTTLAELKSEGLVRHIGVSNFDVAQLRRAEEIAPVETLQPPYSMLIRTDLWTVPFVDNAPPEAVEGEILPYCDEHDIGVIVYSPMASGVLSGSFTRERLESMPEDDWRRADADFTEPLVSRSLALVDRLTPVAERKGCSMGELAIAWALAHRAVDGAVVGLRRPAQVDSLLGAATVELTPADLDEIGALIDEA
jgi:aryl-alcohol dehydrogenase-like predicted oxidoreductase